jgi:hypothetical protein
MVNIAPQVACWWTPLVLIWNAHLLSNKIQDIQCNDMSDALNWTLQWYDVNKFILRSSMVQDVNGTILSVNLVLLRIIRLQRVGVAIIYGHWRSLVGAKLGHGPPKYFAKRMLITMYRRPIRSTWIGWPVTLPVSFARFPQSPTPYFLDKNHDGNGCTSQSLI